MRPGRSGGRPAVIRQPGGVGAIAVVGKIDLNLGEFRALEIEFGGEGEGFANPSAIRGEGWLR